MENLHETQGASAPHEPTDGKGFTGNVNYTPPHPATQFLQDFHGERPWHLVAIGVPLEAPGDSGLRACTFSRAMFGDKRAENAAEWIDRLNKSGAGIYFYPNVIARPHQTKAAKTDVAAATSLYADFDPPGVTKVGEPSDDPAWRAALLKSRAEISVWRGQMNVIFADWNAHGLPCGMPKPTWVIDSGRGYWFYWRLREPVQFDGEDERIALVERHAHGVEQAFGEGVADSVGDVCRLARLPGTVNWKTGWKAHVVGYAPARVYDLSAFPQAAVADPPPPPPEQPAEADPGETGAAAEQRSTDDHAAPPVELMADVLKFLAARKCFEAYEGVTKDADGRIKSIGWTTTGMALRLAYPDTGETLWAETHNSDRARKAAPGKWRSFDTEVKADKKQVTIATIIRAANDAGFKFSHTSTFRAEVYFEEPPPPPEGESRHDGLSLDDFVVHSPTHKYLYLPTGELYVGTIIATRFGREARRFIDLNRTVEQIAWVPGQPRIIEGKLLHEGGWIEKPGVRVFNKYQPPRLARGDAATAGRWVDHIHRIYPEEAEHLIDWFAHRVQRPYEKINHVLALGGAQGIGKDTALEAVMRAVGEWNTADVSPKHLFEPFNSFARCVILRVSEAHDLGEHDRFKFYDHLKIYAAAPPYFLRVNEKYQPQYPAANICGVIITTNHKLDGLYLPADDRRTFVAWSPLTKDDFPEGYWTAMWDWYEAGGYEHVHAFLAERDISKFDPKAPPPKTPAFWQIVEAGQSSEDSEIADLIETLGHPDALTLDDLLRAGLATEQRSIREWLTDPKNTRKIRHRLDHAGYVVVKNPDAQSGRWRAGDGRKVTIYAKASLTIREQIMAAQRRCSP